MIVRTSRCFTAVICGALVATAAFAQQDEPAPPPEEPKSEQAATPAEEPPPAKPKAPLGDPPLHRWGGITVSGEAWGPELTNEDYTIAIISGGLSATTLELPSDAGTRQHWRVWYHLPKDMGAIRFEYDSMDDEGQLRRLTPGQFVYGEVLTSPLFAGVNDDGLADGYAASSRTKTREFRLEYERQAFESPRTSGSFHVGFRTVDHSRAVKATYYALLPTFPPFLPPTFSDSFNPTFLFPLPDSGGMSSDFSGSGLGGGFDVEFKLHPRVSLLGSLSLGVLHGEINTRSSTTSSAYFVNQGGQGVLITFDDVYDIIANATSEAEVLAIFQDEFSDALGVPGRSRLAYEFDLSMAVEFKIWKSLTASVGLRELAYIDVGADVRRAAPFLQPNGTINYQQVSETNRSAAYEGYFLGLSYRF